jgi:hypothetical protein
VYPKGLAVESSCSEGGFCVYLGHGGHSQGNDEDSNWNQLLVYFMQSIGKHHVVVTKKCLRQLGSALI